MIWGVAGQLKTTLERPKRIDYTQRQISPLSFVEGFERVNARLLKLRMHQALQQFRAKYTRFRGENDAAVTVAEIRQLRCEVSLHNWRSCPGNRLTRSFSIHTHKLKLLSVWRLPVR